MSFLFSQPAPGILPANSVDFSEVETIGASTLLGNKLGVESTIQELLTSDVATMLNLAQYAVGPASSTPTSIPVFSDSNGKILVDNSGWRINGSVLMPFADGSGDIGGSATARPGEVWVKTRINLNSLAASEILASDASKNLVSLDTATYPSLTELSYVKGVTSAIQNQLNGKVSSVSGSTPISSSGGTTPTISISDFGGATSLLPGSRGSVPAPAAGDQIRFLRGDATWATAGVDTSGAFDQQVLAYDSGTGLTTWQYAGLGDGNFSTASLILGRGKPTSSTGTKLTLLGTLAGNSLTSGNASVLIGDIGKSITTGLGNIFVGYEYIDGFPQSGYQPVATTTASVGIGISLRATGNDNVAIGYFATAVSDSVAIGSNVTAGTPGAYGGTNHVAIGRNATIYAGNNCVAIGYGSSGFNNSQIAIGAGTSSGGNDAILGPLTGAVNNIVVGANSGYFRNTGGNNTVLGSGSFNNASLTTAANNTIVGQGSATALTTGSKNIFLGYTAGDAVTTGSNNVIIGDIAGTTTLADTIILAAGTNERIRVDSTGNVGIGTTTPGEKLEVNGNIKAGTLSFNADSNRTGTVTNLGFLTNTITHNFGSISHGNNEEVTITVSGAAVGDAVFVGPPAAPESELAWFAYVSATDTVTLRVANIHNANSVDPASTTWRVTVLKS